ncbi:MAG: hypothetical protein ISS93_01940 [Candidatus Aenigmarchaeota archaeon]|nr:hypothetical protein [Candidatus Aenigmarchaeota archaeon]
MGTQKVKEGKPEKAAEKPKEEKKEPSSKVKERAVKKWKGKDWFTVKAPAMFNGKELGEIPATSSQSLPGRTLEVSLADLVNNPSKYHIIVKFRIYSVKDSEALTRFDGLNLVKSQIFRVVRKRTSKVEVVGDVETKDNWKLHYKIFAVLNKVSDQEIQRKVRKKVIGFVKDFASKSSVDDFVKTACDGLIQKNIKKFSSNIYPIRHCEIVKVEVKKPGKA